jgi:hypothetical protein
VVNVTVRSGSIIASANIEAATAAEGIHFEAVAQQRDLSVALPEGIIVRATSVDVDLPLASTVEEEDPPSEGSSNSGAGGASVTTGVIAAVIAVTLVAVVIAAVARRRRHRKVRVESFTKQDGPRGFDTAEFSGGAKTDTFRLASNSAANTITMTRMPRVSTISVLSEGTELESISIPRSSLVTSVADDEDAFTVCERDGSLRLESVRRMNLASNETEM